MEDRKLFALSNNIETQISFSRCDILRYFGFFINACSDYKLTLAEFILRTYNEESFTVYEVRKKFIELVEPFLVSLNMSNSDCKSNELHRFYPLRIDLNSYELSFFAESILIFTDFIHDMILESLTYKIKTKNSFKESLKVNDYDFLLHACSEYIKWCKPNQSQKKHYTNIIKSFYPDIYKIMIKFINPDDAYLPLVKCGLYHLVYQQMNQLVKPILLPKIDSLTDFLQKLIYRKQQTFSNDFFNDVAQYIDSFKIYQNDHFDSPFLMQNHWYSDNTIDNNSIVIPCDECEALHNYESNGLNIFPISSIRKCHFLQEKQLDKFKAYFQSGSFNKPTSFQEFMISNIVLAYINNTTCIDNEEEFKKIQSFFDGKFMQLFFIEIIKHLLPAYLNDCMYIRRNNLKYRFIIEENKFGEFDADDIIKSIPLKGFSIIDGIEFTDSLKNENPNSAKYMDIIDSTCESSTIYKVIYIYWLCITFSDTTYNINPNCL